MRSAASDTMQIAGGVRLSPVRGGITRVETCEIACAVLYVYLFRNPQTPEKSHRIVVVAGCCLVVIILFVRLIFRPYNIIIHAHEHIQRRGDWPIVYCTLIHDYIRSRWQSKEINDVRSLNLSTPSQHGARAEH